MDLRWNFRYQKIWRVKLVGQREKSIQFTSAQRREPMPQGLGNKSAFSHTAAPLIGRRKLRWKLSEVFIFNGTFGCKYQSCALVVVLILVWLDWLQTRPELVVQ